MPINKGKKTNDNTSNINKYNFQKNDDLISPNIFIDKTKEEFENSNQNMSLLKSLKDEIQELENEKNVFYKYYLLGFRKRYCSS